MPVCAQVRGPAVASRFPHRPVLAHVSELCHRVSADERQDLRAGEPTADGDAQSVRLCAAQSFSKRGREPDSRAGHPNRGAHGRGTCYIWLISLIHSSIFYNITPDWMTALLCVKRA